MKGFISQDLVSSLREIECASLGTRAKKPIFSLSLNPPPDEKVPTETFEKTICRVEKTLGLEGQPRAVIFHTKSDGRRHCHTVWSRIDTTNMKAIHLSHTKRKLMRLSKEIYREQGWSIPEGMISKEKRSDKNFTLAQWQQAKRLGKDPREIKETVQDCWTASTNQQRLTQLLKQKGFSLAKGDRRGVVLIDQHCEVYSLVKWAGIRAKQVKEMIADNKSLPSVDEAKQKISKDMIVNLNQAAITQKRIIDERRKNIVEKHRAMKEAHIIERNKLKQGHEIRWIQETKERQARYSRGLRALVDIFTGRQRQIRLQNMNETLQATLRDKRESDQLIFKQLAEKRSLLQRVERLKKFREQSLDVAKKDQAQYIEIMNRKRDVFTFRERLKSINSIEITKRR